MASPSRTELKSYVGMGSRHKKAMCTYMLSILQQTYVLPQPQSHLWSIQQMGELRETEAREKSQVKTKSWELRHIAWHVVRGLNKTLAAETMLPLTHALDKEYLDQGKRSHQTTVFLLPFLDIVTHVLNKGSQTIISEQ